MLHGSHIHFMFILTVIIRIVIGNNIYSKKNTLCIGAFYLSFCRSFSKEISPLHLGSVNFQLGDLKNGFQDPVSVFQL